MNNCSKVVTHEVIVVRIAYLTAVMDTQLRFSFQLGRSKGFQQDCNELSTESVVHQ